MSDSGMSCSMSSRRGRAVLWALIAILLLAAIAGLVAWQSGIFAPKVEALSAAEVAEVLEQRNVAIGMIENHTDHQRAAELFESLAKTLPDEILPIQNAAICALDGMETADPEDKPNWYQPTRVALDRLLKKTPDSAAANYLMAYYLSKLPPSNDEEQQRQINQEIIRLCEKASAADPSEPGFPMKIFFVYSNSFDDSLRPAMEKAIRRAYEIAPDKLRIIREWLAVQIEKKDPEIVKTLEHARELLGPLMLSMRGGDNLARADGARGVPYEIESKINAAIEAAEAGDWNAVAANVGPFNAGLLTLMNYRDESVALEPNPLNFVVHEFSDAFYKRNPISVEEEIRDVSFRFATTSKADGLPADRRVIAVQCLDMNLDRQPDWGLLCQGELRIYGRDDTGTLQLIASALVADDVRGLIAADLDLDNSEGRENIPGSDKRKWHSADSDFIVYGGSGIQVFRNRVDDAGARTLEAVENPPELISDSAVDVLRALPIDFDHDADLDLVLATTNGLRLWSARGNGTFEDITKWSRLPDENVNPVGLVAVDWDRDADLDVIVASASDQPSGILQNEQHGHMTWVPLSGFANSNESTSVAVAEFDGNASWDLVFAGAKGVRAYFTAMTAPRQIRLIHTATLTEEAREHVIVADVDNNSYPDVLAWSNSEVDLFLGGPNRKFQRAQKNILDADLDDIQTISFADIDDDGDQDLLAASGQTASMLENDGGNSANWFKLRLIGDCLNDGCVGHTGIGSTLEIKTGSRYQAQVVTGEVSHFGLGTMEQADVLRIIATTGVPQSIIEPDANQYLSDKIKLSGSCPYVYTWTGERFDFFTDLLWAAPLGMQTSRGTLLPSREWEYILIPGDRLHERNGTYDLQITEELWEAAYFDHVQLLAVDHPTDVSVYSNEKVGPPEIAPFKVHTVRTPRLPVAAHDQNGNDILPLIREADENHVAPWDNYIRRGRTSPHHIELDLGRLEHPQQITLYLTGWILPAGTSLNLQYSQNSDVGLPAMPSIWVPNAEGEWIETIPYMGFPGGKTKTVAIDLTSAFLTNDYRLRIATSAQIYWDHIFFAVDEGAEAVEITACELAYADLHYRGFSEPSGYQGTSPETYFYENVTTDPQWPPMRGNFTRYGDVQPLVSIADDQMVVLGAGDEMTLRFRVPDQKLKDGWKRDFILHSIGWDKDADPNTILGQAVEPLPYRGITAYPYDPADGPSGREYENYLRTYQTRQQDQIDFWLWTKRWGE